LSLVLESPLSQLEPKPWKKGHMPFIWGALNTKLNNLPLMYKVGASQFEEHNMFSSHTRLKRSTTSPPYNVCLDWINLMINDFK